MRFLNGIVVGILLTIGAAYWHDQVVRPDSDGEPRVLVNWTEFSRTMAVVSDWIHVQWNELTANTKQT